MKREGTFKREGGTLRTHIPSYFGKIYVMGLVSRRGGRRTGRRVGG